MAVRISSAVVTAIGIEFLAVLLTGFGHGPRLPLLLTMGPASLLWPLTWIGPEVQGPVFVAFLALTPALYGVYAFLLSKPLQATPRRTLSLILCIHYGSAVGIMALLDDPGVTTIRIADAGVVLPLLLVWLALFAGVHVAAFQVVKGRQDTVR